MAQWYLKSKRKPSGALLKRHMKKKKYQRGRDYLPAHIGEIRRRQKRTKGGSSKLIALSINVANINIGGKAQKAKITSVLENPANPQYVRRNIITKGAVIQTELGKARVTSRPGQDGVVSAVIIEQTPKASSSSRKEKDGKS